MRSRNSLIRERCEAFRDARLIVIAAEGKDTERIYFEALAKKYTNPRVHVHILKRKKEEQNNSSPEHVLKQLVDYEKQYELESDDELWLVVDRDRWTDAMLSNVATKCAQSYYLHISLSNPCFLNFGFYYISLMWLCYLRRNGNFGLKTSGLQKTPIHI